MALLITLLCLTAGCGQLPVGSGAYRSQGAELLDQSRYAEAEIMFRAWVRALPRDAEAHYQLALVRALQGRTIEARNGFLEVVALDPRRADAYFELAATFLRSGDYAGALHWSRRGLEIAPADAYGADLRGTVLYLAGEKEEAIKVWNKISRPHLTRIDIQTTGGLSRGRIAEEIDLAPGKLLSWFEVERAEVRLAHHKYVRRLNFTPVPNGGPDDYRLDVVAHGRRGLGSLSEFMLNTLQDAWFHKLHVDFWNIAGSGATISSSWRWANSAQSLRLQLSAPRPLHLPVYPSLTYSTRRESWYFPQTGKDYQLATREWTIGAWLPVHVPALSVEADVTARSRGRLGPAPGGSAGSTDAGRFTPGVTWIKTRPRASIGSWHLGSWRARSRVWGEVSAGWTSEADRVSQCRLSASGEAKLDRRVRGRQLTLTGSMHGGWLPPTGLPEDYFILGYGPDADFPLRGHAFLRGGRPGTTPLTRSFRLSNLSAATDLKRWSAVTVGAMAFVDVAQDLRTYAAQALPKTMVDTGIGLEVGSSLASDRRLTLTLARNGHDRSMFLYLAASLR